MKYLPVFMLLFSLPIKASDRTFQDNASNQFDSLVTQGVGAAATRGSETRNWLQLQTSGSFATIYEDMLTPQSAESTRIRLEQSFEYPIPDKFIKDKMGE